MLTKREQIMNMELSKNNSFIIKRKYISEKSVIDFKENGDEILRKDNIEQIENGRTIQREQDRQIQRFRKTVQRESKFKTE